MEDVNNDAALWYQIHEIDRKIAACDTARETVRNVHSQCQSQTDDCRTSYNKITANADLKAVRKTDTFEGKMAESMGTLIADELTSIRSGLTAAANLEAQLKQQIVLLDRQIASLRSQRTTLMNQLSSG